LFTYTCEQVTAENEEDTRASENPQGEVQQQNAALAKVTTETTERALDANKAKAAITKLTITAKQKPPTVAERIKALSSVQVKTEHIDLIANEFDIRRDIAELTLREHNGDAVAAMRALLAQ